MTDSRVGRWLLLAVVASCLIHAPAFATESGGSSARRPNAGSLDDLYRRAKLAYDADRFDDCKRILREASEMTPVMLVLLAQAECELRQFKACATHAAESLKSPEHRPDKRAAIEEILADAVRELGSLILSVNVSGAEVLIDGQLVGVSPIDRPIYIEPGAHRLSVNRAGEGTVVHQIAVQKGSTLQLDIVLRDASSVDPGQRQPEAVDASLRALPIRVERIAFEVDATPTRRPSIAVLVTGGTIALGGLAAGLYYNGRSSNDFDRANQLKRVLDPGTCAQNNQATRLDCDNLRQSLDSGDRERNYSTLSLAIGGIAAVSTVVYWLWPRANGVRSGIEHSRLVGSPLPGGAWLMLINDF